MSLRRRFSGIQPLDDLIAYLTVCSNPAPHNLFSIGVRELSVLFATLSRRKNNSRRLDATNDYDVNLKAELEIMSLHEKVDSLREQQWRDLIELQQEQIRLLMTLLSHRESSGGGVENV